jgi:hypothetical protein
LEKSENLAHADLWDIVLSPADAVRSIQEIIPIAQSGFRISVDREHDRLHMMVAVNTISAEQVLGGDSDLQLRTGWLR